MRTAGGAARGPARGLARVLRLASLALVPLLFRCAMAAGAGSDPGYLGTHLAPGFTAFAASSPWRTPIGASPTIDANSAAMISRLVTTMGSDGLSLQVTEYTAPIHVVDSSQSRKVSVKLLSKGPDAIDPDQDGIAQDIPIPESVWPDPSPDGHCVIVDPALRVAWEFWQFRKASSGASYQYEAGMSAKWDLDGNGYNVPLSSDYWWLNGATAPRTAYIGGLIRYEEAAAGSIEHALNIITPINRRSSTVGGDLEFYSPVASDTDGQGVGTDYIPEGARIQLNPAFDLAQPLGPFNDHLNAAAVTIAKALQKYGAYVMDSGAGFGLKAQNLGPDGGSWANLPIPNLYLIPLDQFRVLQGNLYTKKP